ncbi:MAG TPA: PP2C family protein-serine/threonine phosphatase [Terracidiphilus sp.]
MIFLLAVFSVFAGIGFTNDSIDMGHEPKLRFAVSVLLTGLFAVVYASGGVILRRNFWKLFIPVFLLQIGSLTLLAHFLPDSPHLAQLDTAGTTVLSSRLAFDGTAIIFSIALGYAGFVHVAISESRRYIGAETERARLEGEMTAAREIQRVMVPDALPAVAGYSIESVYRPAAQVGGDFFQVLRLKSGRTLLVIGDVSGKGLSAAMIVSTIVGMLWVVSTFTEEPAEILCELNRRLCGRTHGGFATCLIVRLEADGKLTLADAGHPSPYLNGTEFTLTGSMPLGLTENAAYGQTSVVMRAGDRAVLLTDGIPEARNKEGALLGFARVESLLQEGADVHTVAETAQHYGQNDDLTVISIARAQ